MLYNFIKILIIFLLTIIGLGFRFLFQIPIASILNLQRRIVKIFNSFIEFQYNMLSVLKGERVLVIDFGALYKAIGLWNDEDEDDDDNSNLITKHY